MSPIFYDTNALLLLQDKAFLSPFYMSVTTLQELENIKTSRSKDDNVKWQSRHILKLLEENQNVYTVVNELVFVKNHLAAMGIEDNPDNRICCAATLIPEVTFVTDDLACRLIAQDVFNLKVSSVDVNDSESYKGYTDEILTDEDMAYFYQHLDHNVFGLINNQYLIVRDLQGNIVDRMKWDGESHKTIKVPNVKSNLFGIVKPNNGDVYQQLAMDSMCNNQITMIKGAAGTGKSYLSIGVMLSLLEKHKIDKIIIFANPVPTVNSARIGFLPGTQLDKLLDSAIGHMLSSKLGDKYMIEQLVSQNKLSILPMCDIRGFDTTGMKSAVYITEAQNLDVTLMKLALQRIGEDSICLIDGDYNTQVDLAQYSGMNNGMKRMSEVFRGQNFYGEVELQNIYRSKIAQMAENM